MNNVKQNIIENIMNNFDFHKVWKVMCVTDWVWAMPNPLGGMAIVRTPTETEIRDTARQLISECIDRECTSLSTRGFTVQHEDEGYTLSFCVEESFSDGKEDDF